MIGIVKKSTGSSYELWDENYNVLNASLKGKFKMDGIKSTNPIAVGDKVSYTWDEQHQIAIIDQLFSRKNYIIRKSNNLSKQTHIIASNIDLMVIVATITSPRTSQGFIDRLLVTAEAYGIDPLIVFNKKDILDADDEVILQRNINMYAGIPYPTIIVSALNGEGMAMLKELLQHKITLFTGHSGAGKSTLINKLNPELNIKSNSISTYSDKGKHTTTFAEMYKINKDTFLIDTPGIKEFGIVDISKEELGQYFPEINALRNACKFNNCLHINEPGCAVISALNNKLINSNRYHSYMSILKNEDTHH